MPEPIRIGLWGASAAGKTAFLAHLYLKPAEPDSAWRVYPTPESRRFLEALRPDLEQNRFPKATAFTQEINRVSYRFANRFTGQEAELLLEDRPGKDSEKLTDDTQRLFNQVQGLVVLVDPGGSQRPLRTMIEDALSSLNVNAERGARQDTRPVAVCLSKADRLIRTPADLRQATLQPRQFVLERIDPNLLKWVDLFCSNFELFPVSSVGVRMRYGVIEPAVFMDETLTLRMSTDGVPVNLLAPFVWLFGQLQEAGRQ